MRVSEYRERVRREVEASPGQIDDDTNAIVDLALDKTRIGKLIDAINDDLISVDKKAAAIDALNAASNFSPLMRRRMPEIVNALRGHLDSDDRDLRQRALGTLAALKDEVAQDLLIAELRSERPAAEKLVPTAASIAMLGSDEKALPLPLLRRIIDTPPDDEALVEALRHIPSHPDVFDSLKQVLESEELPLEARSMVPEMASEIAPAEFVAVARNLLRTRGTSHELAPFLVKGIARASAPEAVAEVAAAKAEVANVLDDAPEPFRAAALDLLGEDDVED